MKASFCNLIIVNFELNLMCPEGVGSKKKKTKNFALQAFLFQDFDTFRPQFVTVFACIVAAQTHRPASELHIARIKLGLKIQAWCLT